MKKGEDEGSDEILCPLWMVSFGDCMSLLVTFFVMLIAFSDMEESALMELIGALQGGFRATPTVSKKIGTSRSSKSLASVVGESEEPQFIDVEDMSNIPSFEPLHQKRSVISQEGDTDREMIVDMLDEGMSFVIQAAALFEQGTARMVPSSEDPLTLVADLSSELLNEIRIVGYLPPDYQIRDVRARTPWGLAAQRGLSIKEALVRDFDFAPERFSIGSTVHGPDDVPPYRRGFSFDRVEIIVIGYHKVDELPPEAVVIRDRWN